MSSTRWRIRLAAFRMICVRLAGDVLRQVANPRSAAASASSRSAIVAVGDGAEDAFVGGIDHGLAARALPAAVDIEFDFEIICHDIDHRRLARGARNGCTGRSVGLDQRVLIWEGIKRYI